MRALLFLGLGACSARHAHPLDSTLVEPSPAPQVAPEVLKVYYITVTGHDDETRGPPLRADLAAHGLLDRSERIAGFSLRTDPDDQYSPFTEDATKVLLSSEPCQQLIAASMNSSGPERGLLSETVNCTSTLPECCVPLQYLGREGPCAHKDGYWNFPGNENSAYSACSNMAGETLAYINMLRAFAHYAESTGQSGYAIMLEDDARVHSADFAADLAYVLHEQKGWDLLKLHGGGTPEADMPKPGTPAFEKLAADYKQLETGTTTLAKTGINGADPEIIVQNTALSNAGAYAHLGDVAMMVHSSNALKVVSSLIHSGPNIFPAGLDWNLVNTQLLTDLKVVDSIRCLMYPSYLMDESSTIGSNGQTMMVKMTATPPTSAYYPQSTCILNKTKTR